MSNEIKECPYCGGPAKLITIYAPGWIECERYRFVCNGIYEDPIRICPRHHTGTIEQATEAWNTRADTDALATRDARIAALEGEVERLTHEVESAGALRLRMESHKQTANKERARATAAEERLKEAMRVIAGYIARDEREGVILRGDIERLRVAAKFMEGKIDDGH